MTFGLVLENLGPIRGNFELKLDKPVTIITGDTGTGKTFILKMLSLLIRHLSSSFNVKSLEEDVRNEFGHVPHIVTVGEKQGLIKLHYADEDIASLRFYSIKENKIFDIGWIEKIYWRGGVQPIAEYSSNSVLALDERIPLVRAAIIKSQSSTVPSANAYLNAFIELCKKNDPILEESLHTLNAINILPRVPSYFDRGIVRGIDARMLSASVVAFLSLAPVINRLLEGRALFAAVDTIELHLTPLLQIAATVNLVRFAKFGWRRNEEQPVPLIITTHSSTVLAALVKEIEDGISNNKITNLGKDYKLNDNDIQTVILYRENGNIKWQIESGVIQLPTYLNEYVKLFY